MLPKAFIEEYRAEAIKYTITPQNEEENLENESDYLKAILKHYDESLHAVVRFLLIHGIEFNSEEGIILPDFQTGTQMAA